MAIKFKKSVADWSHSAHMLRSKRFFYDMDEEAKQENAAMQNEDSKAECRTKTQSQKQDAERLRGQKQYSGRRLLPFLVFLVREFHDP